jgi:glycosyltransferase involved in cell wall biosynthesis
MAMHVLQLGPYPPPEGGITRNMLAIRERLREKGHRCSIIATSRSASIDGEPGVSHPRSAAELIKLLRRSDHDVLHLHVGGDISRRVLSLALAATVFGGPRTVLTMHSGGYARTDDAKRASPESARGRIFRRFSGIIAVNDELADMFRRYGVDASWISVIAPHALEPPDETVAVDPRLKAFCENHSPLLVAVGGLEVDYEPMFLVAAIEDILRDHPRAGLMIVGSGSMKNEVESAVAASGNADAICLAGDVPHAQALHLIQRADVMLRTTLFDGDAISVREALFFGTPVIATDNGMRPEGVRLIAQGDRAGLLERIREALNAKSEREPTLEADHSNIERVIDLYSSLL